MEDIGCPVSPSMHIVVEKCHGTFDGYGGFDSENNEIVLCEEKFASLASPTAKRKMDMILSHELVHAYDHCRSNVDFYDDAGHSMCTEVRAAALSGQCMLRYNIPPAVLGGFKKHHQKCVRSHAMNSFKTLHPTWSTKKSSHLLDQVFKPCYNDTEPFDRVPLTKNQADLSYKAYVTRNRYRVWLGGPSKKRILPWVCGVRIEYIAEKHLLNKTAPLCSGI